MFTTGREEQLLVERVERSTRGHRGRRQSRTWRRHITSADVEPGMALDVEIPDPPSLHGPQPRDGYESTDMSDQDVEDDYRREEVENFLREGAWEEAFGQWADLTSLSEDDFRTITDLGLIDEFDFYWDPGTDEVGYISPSIPQEKQDAFGSGDVGEYEAELDLLGREVSEMLENDYLLRDDDDEQFGFFDDDYTGEDPADESE